MFMANRLVSVDLSRSTVTDRQMESLVVGNESIQVLILADCPNVTNITLRFVSTCLFRTLRHVNVSRNTNIDYEGLAWLAGGRGNTSQPCKVRSQMPCVDSRGRRACSVTWWCLSCTAYHVPQRLSVPAHHVSGAVRHCRYHS